MAKRDFDGVGLKDVFKKSFQAVVHLVRLAKHTSKLKGWLLENLRWRNDNTEIGIPNQYGQYEYFPAEFIKWYTSMPPQIMKKLVDVVEEGRALTIGVLDDDVVLQEKVTIRDKRIFTHDPGDEIDDEFIFPELEHGMDVRLEGKLIRGNAETNSIGLDYRGHNLNCVPEQGSVVQYKPALFLRCLVEGRVTRLSKTHTAAERRPTIIVRRIVPLEVDHQQPLL